jgi:hypothetical protein
MRESACTTMQHILCLRESGAMRQPLLINVLIRLQSHLFLEGWIHLSHQAVIGNQRLERDQPLALAALQAFRQPVDHVVDLMPTESDKDKVIEAVFATKEASSW